MSALRAARLADVPPWYAPAGFALAAVAGGTLIGRPTGLGLTLVLEGLVAAGSLIKGTGPLINDAQRIPANARKSREPKIKGPVPLINRAWWLLAALLALTPTFRTAPWVVALAITGSLALAAAASGAARTGRQLALVAAEWLTGVVIGPLVLAGLAGRSGSNAALRGAALAALLVAAFGALFMAADATFGHLIGDLLPSGDNPLARFALAAAVAGVSGALVLVRLIPETPAPEPAHRLGRTETTIALAALTALFAAFVAVQAAALFGGDSYIRRTAGLSYAEYARQGFALLLVVAALTLAVVATANRFARADRRLLAALCVLTVVVLASAWHRLDLYTDAYGATRMRYGAAFCIVWLAGVFALVLAPTRIVLARAVVTWSALLGVAFVVSNPDARIAANANQHYRRSLSADARGCLRGERDLWSFTVGC